MYDREVGFYYCDVKYLYLFYKIINGKKDFWLWGDGWVFVVFVKVLK